MFGKLPQMLFLGFFNTVFYCNRTKQTATGLGYQSKVNDVCEYHRTSNSGVGGEKNGKP